VAARAAGRRAAVTGGLLRALWLPLLAASALVPLGVLVVRSIAREWFFPTLVPARGDFESWGALLTSGRIGAALATSVALALATGVLAAAAAFPVGRAMADLRGWRRGLAAGCAFLPVAVPPVALGAGLHISFLGLGLAGTFGGVLLAHLVPALGYASLFFLGVFGAYDPGFEDDARGLGASGTQVLRHVTLPLLRRPLLEAVALGALVSWAQVPLTLLIGGGAVRTLPVEVLAYIQAGQDRYAATGALLLVVPAIAMLGAATLAARRTEVVPA
jgi:ABC-type spermidine/putrescine transport system permease subunit II